MSQIFSCIRTLIISLEISRAKALAKFPGSGAAQEAARKKMGLKSRQNRVNSFFLDLWAAGSVVNAGSGNRMARFRQNHSAALFERKFLNGLSLYPFFKPVLKLARRRLFKGLLTRIVRAASYRRVIFAGQPAM
jgi:hypothetical protein